LPLAEPYSQYLFAKGGSFVIKHNICKVIVFLHVFFMISIVSLARYAPPL